MENYLTTIQADTETRDQLKKLADADDRSLKGELRWLIAQENARRIAMQQTPVIGVIDSTTGVITYINSEAK